MTADPEPGPRLAPTGPAPLIGWGLVGLVLGWGLHGFANRFLDSAPIVSWAQPLALLLVAMILGYAAYALPRTGRRLAPHQMLNRFVLARACAYVGALVAGGYFGYALSWLGNDAELAGQRLLRSALAGGFSVLIVVAALLLERACRVPEDDASA